MSQKGRPSKGQMPPCVRIIKGYSLFKWIMANTYPREGFYLLRTGYLYPIRHFKKNVILEWIKTGAAILAKRNNGKKATLRPSAILFAYDFAFKMEKKWRIHIPFTERERKIIELRTGYPNNERQTLEEIGKTYCVSRERIRQIENKAAKKTWVFLKCISYFEGPFNKRLITKFMEIL